MASSLSSAPSEVLISIQPPQLAALAVGSKHHEVRAHDVPSTRWWIYEPAPMSALVYVADVRRVDPATCACPSVAATDSEAKSEPEAEAEDAAAVEGAAAGSSVPAAPQAAAATAAPKHVFEVVRLEELERPVPLLELRRRGWLRGVPHAYAAVSDDARVALAGQARRLVFDRSKEPAAATTGEALTAATAALTISEPGAEVAEAAQPDQEAKPACACDAVRVVS